jgi:hypothetical protein
MVIVVKKKTRMMMMMMEHSEGGDVDVGVERTANECGRAMKLKRKK